jgi:hypothetical protein
MKKLSYIWGLRVIITCVVVIIGIWFTRPPTLLTTLKTKAETENKQVIENSIEIITENDANMASPSEAMTQNVDDEPSKVTIEGAGAIMVNTEEGFGILPIDEALKASMQDKSFRPNDVIGYEDLRLVKVLYIGYDDAVHEGELVVHKVIAEKVIKIFKTLYEAQFPIERMTLIDAYDADDDLSMQANNTSAFNFRRVSGTDRLSNHAYGLAIDINPLVNPYVTASGVSPKEGEAYTDRTLDVKGIIREGDVCYNAFIENGFTWGGAWVNSKDYQHFEIKVDGINQ